MEVKLLVRAVLDSGVLRAWTGEGAYELDEPFKPDGSSPGDTGVYTDGAVLLEGADATVRFGLRGRGLTATPVVGRVVDVFSVGFLDDGTSKRLPFVRRGLLDAPMLVGGEYSVSIAPRAYQAHGGQWSHEEHMRDHPGDKFFSQTRALAKGLRGIHFPGVPNFEEDGNYDIRAVQQPKELGGRRRAVPRGNPDAGLSRTAAALVRLPASRSNVRRGL